MSIGKGILDVLFPPVCVLCGERVERVGMLCEYCLSQLEYTDEGRLRDNLTEDVLSDLKQVDRASAYVFYDKESAMSSLIHAAKYGTAPRPEILYYLSRNAAKDWADTGFFDGIDVIIPVPLHKERFWERGFNQAEWIANGLADELGIPVDTEHLKRVVNNEHQARSRGEERQQNVQGIFSVDHPEEMFRKHILLVDDVITTGSTIRECVKTMKAFRGSHIVVFALAKPR